MAKITYLIVPAWSDQGGCCRIVARDHDLERAPDLNDYRRAPQLWENAGHMNSRGQLIALTNAKHFSEMKPDEPLSAPTTYTFEE